MRYLINCKLIYFILLILFIFQFDPEVVIVVQGDSNIITPAIHAYVISLLMNFARGKVMIAASEVHIKLTCRYCVKTWIEITIHNQQGVKNLRNMKTTASCLRILIGDPCPSIGSLSEPRQMYVIVIFKLILIHVIIRFILYCETIYRTIEKLSPFWKMLPLQANWWSILPRPVNNHVYTQAIPLVDFYRRFLPLRSLNCALQ